MLLDFASVVPQAGADLTESAERLVFTLMQLALPVLRAIGVVVIIWGVFRAAFRLVRMEAKGLRATGIDRTEARSLRQHLGFYLLLGMELLIAVDIIESLMHPEWKELGILAGLVGIRILLSLSLGWELKDSHEQRQSEEAPDAA